MLVNSDILLKDASKKGYAIPSYNINNLEWTKYILEACEEDNSPVILAITPTCVNYFGGYKVVYSIVNSLIDDLKISIPVVLHLDHASCFYECKRAIDEGFTSVMIDASKEDLENNISITNKVIEYARKHEVSVEAEIGSICENELYTNLDDAIKFVLETNVDSLAPAIGNYHGIYKKDIKLNFELLAAIEKETRIPLVLHGASFLSDNMLKTAIFCGVCKINVNTELQKVWSDKVRFFLQFDKDVYDPRKIIKSGEKDIKKKIHYNNLLFDSKNRAN